MVCCLLILGFSFDQRFPMSFLNLYEKFVKLQVSIERSSKGYLFVIRKKKIESLVTHFHFRESGTSSNGKGLHICCS